MKRYIKVTLILIKNCFSRDTAFRLPFTFWVIANLLWLWVYVYTVDLLFANVPIIAGWNAVDGKVLVLVNGLFATIVWIFILPNLTIFWKLIYQGTMDFHLLKPISARFLSSATYFEFDMIPRLVPIVLILVPLIESLPRIASVGEIVLFCVAMLLGVVIFYNFGYMVVTTCFWLTKIDSVEDFLTISMNNGRFPADVFKGAIKVVFSYLVPSIFVSVFPAMILLGKGNLWEIILVSLIFAVATSLISQWFWNFALKHYSSASS